MQPWPQQAMANGLNGWFAKETWPVLPWRKPKVATASASLGRPKQPCPRFATGPQCVSCVTPGQSFISALCIHPRTALQYPLEGTHQDLEREHYFTQEYRAACWVSPPTIFLDNRGDTSKYTLLQSRLCSGQSGFVANKAGQHAQQE